MTHAPTASGMTLDLARPEAKRISIRDIAGQLACVNRFNGANIRRSGSPYTVAQHSVIVAKLAERRLAARPLIALQALLHDAHEAFTGDLTTPFKNALGTDCTAVNHVQYRLDVAIHAALGVPLPGEFENEIIQFCDAVAFATEWRDLMPGASPSEVTPASFAVKPLRWDLAEECFLTAFHRLTLAAGITSPRRIPTDIFK